MLQTYINQSITVGYKLSSQHSSTSSSDSRRQRKKNWQHQQDEAPGAPLVSCIHRPARRSRIYVYENTIFKMEVTEIMYQTLVRIIDGNYRVITLF